MQDFFFNNVYCGQNKKDLKTIVEFEIIEMLKNVDDSGSLVEKIDSIMVKDSGKSMEEPTISKKNKVKTDEPVIRRVRFSGNDIEIQENDNISPVTDVHINGSTNTQAPILPSILKVTKHYPHQDSRKSIDDSFDEAQDSESLESRRKAKGRRSILAQNTLSNSIRTDKSNSLITEQKLKRHESEERDSAQPSTAGDITHNTRTRLRKSFEYVRSGSPEVEFSDDSSNNNDLSDGDTPFTNGTISKRGRGRGRVRGRGTGRGRGRGRPRGRPRGSGRGRGRNQGREGGGDGDRSWADNSGESSMDTSTLADNGEEDVEENVEENIAPPSIEVEGELVKCARCGSEMPKTKWQVHNLSQHNNMGWLESSPAMDFDNDQKLLNRVLVNAHKKKKGVLNCEKCGIAKRSVAGFISHMQFCGKTVEERSALLMTCPICQRTMMPSSMEVHHRVHKETPDSENSDNIGPQSSKIVATGSKRKAAERAISKISEFTALVRDDEVPAVKKPRSSSPTIKKMIQRPQLKKTIPGVLRMLWKKEITNNGVALCRQPGCQEKYTVIDDIYKHYATCNFTPRKTFSCKLCKFDSENEAEIVNHVAEHHASEVVSNDESESEGEISEDESDNGQSKKKNQSTSRLSHHWRGRPKSWHKIEFLSKEETPHLNKPYLPAVNWTLEFKLENYRLDLFSDLVPNVFQLLDTEEANNYLPELKVSMAMQKMHMKRHNEEIQSSNIEWKRWSQFEGNVEEGMPTFFVGGPVWAMSWLPIPLRLFSHNVDQYLAVSTHPTMESEYSLGCSYAGKNIVQIWNVGKLNNKEGRIEGLPSLAYAIAHNSGTIWCIEWCPSGCYQNELLFNHNSKNGEHVQMRRMGLLATACSDGCVRIYSLPFPEELESCQSGDSSNHIFKTEPVMTLVVNSIMYDSGKQNWQCTKLNWTKENGHDTIAAGFSNGYVALWNLTAKSPLLVKKKGTTTFINAAQHFFAHGHAVSAVSLVPYGGKRFLATAGLDRCYKFWNLENISAPQSVLKRGVVVDGAWMTHWPTAVNSYDDVLGLNHTSTNLVSIREYGYKLCLGLATNSPVYSVSVSDYGNAIAHGTLAGEVQTAFPHQLLVGIDVDRTVAKKRRLNSFVKIVDLCGIDGIIKKSPTNQETKKSKKNSEEYVYRPDTYEGCKDRFGIIFYDMPSDCKEHIPTEIQKKTLQTDELSMVPLESYPFTSVNKISWNPNAWSYLWLATGYQCGIIKISCFKSMYIPATDKELLPKFVERQSAKEKDQNS